MMPLDDLLNGPQFAPVEDLLLELLWPLEDEIPGLIIRSLIPDGVTCPFVLVRREPGAYSSASFGFAGDDRFLMRSVVKVNTFTADPDGDAKGALLQDVIRRRLSACHHRQVVVPEMGSIARIQTSAPAQRVSDWATSTGVVQYANLPKGAHRYEATYGLVVRAAHTTRNPLAVFEH